MIVRLIDVNYMLNNSLASNAIIYKGFEEPSLDQRYATIHYLVYQRPINQCIVTSSLKKRNWILKQNTLMTSYPNQQLEMWY